MSRNTAGIEYGGLPVEFCILRQMKSRFVLVAATARPRAETLGGVTYPANADVRIQQRNGRLQAIDAASLHTGVRQQGPVLVFELTASYAGNGMADGFEESLTLRGGQAHVVGVGLDQARVALCVIGDRPVI